MIGANLRRLRRSTLATNAAALYGAHLAGMLVPLATIPYLARVLRPEAFGLVVFAQSFGAWGALLVEYGFDLSGTRAVARSRNTSLPLENVVAGVQGGKSVVLLVVTTASAALFLVVPAFAEHSLLFFWAWAFAATRGFSPFWFFQGKERMTTPTALEAGAKVVAALGIFVWVHEPEHGWRVLALQAIMAGLSAVLMTSWMYREVPLRIPRPREALHTLREGAGIFVFRGASGLYIQANAFILGLLSTAQAVAFFGGAEKIVRAAVNLLHPLTQVIFPRLSHLVVTDPRRARRLLRFLLVGMVGFGLAMGITAFLAAPLLVRLLLGPGYEAAVPVLRILAFLPPVVAVGTVFGLNWALPLGLEKPFYRLVLVAGILNVILALILVPRWGAVGMAIGVVGVDVLVSAGLLVLYRIRGQSVWRHWEARTDSDSVPGFGR